jgi:hypothetical protein
MADNQSMLAGLFSTPEQYQQQRQAVQRAQAIQMAQLDPFQQGQANVQMGFNRIADVGAGALGIQDPQLKLQSFRQQVLRGVDQTDPESLAQASYALNREGDTAGARQLAQLAQEAALKQSQITRNMREGRAAANKIVEANGRQYLVDTVTGKQIADIGAVGEKTKVTEANGRTLLINERTGALIKDLGVAPQRGTNVNVSQKQEEAVTKSNVEAFGALRDEAINAGKTIESVQAIKPLINQAFTGFAANTKLTAGQIADTFGIPVQGTTETEKLRSIQNNLKIGNSTVLKGAISDKDMAILGEAIGQGNTTAGGIRGIINDLEKNALISQAKYQRANKFQQEGKLAQYDFVEGDKSARNDVNAKLKRLRELESKAAQGGK